MFQVCGSLSLPCEIDADVMVIAGNTHRDPEIHRQVLRTTEDELGLPEPMGLWMVWSEARARRTADSDEAGRLFQGEAGHLFRFHSGQCSEVKPDTLLV
jgi:hypothetical protein